MRVAYDEQIFLLQRTGGISRYFVELIEHFARDPGVEVLLPRGPVANDLAAAAFGMRQAASRSGRRALLARRRWRPPPPNTTADLVHHTFYDPAWLQRPLAVPRVVTVYDMIPEALPDQVPPGVHLAKREYVAAADLILTISEFTRQELFRFFGRPNAPVVVTPLGVDDRFFAGGPPLDQLPARYLLYVGNRAGYKDFATLLRAVADHPDLPDLVAIGGGAWTAAEQGRVAELGIAPRVRRLDLTDTELINAYVNADAFVLPSWCEGFGLPMLEAMAAGTPVVAARAGALPEIGGHAALYFQPGDAEALAGALAAVLADVSLREKMTQAGQRRAREYTWDRTAASTAAAYRSVLGGV